jgi:hypothetical protein
MQDVQKAVQDVVPYVEPLRETKAPLEGFSNILLTRCHYE